MIDGLIVDCFAGGGGASTGIERALNRPVDISINHDAAAVAMHEANHPWSRHYRENIFAVDPSRVCGGRPVDLAWFSPDCTHFSAAKGGKPRKKNIRGLAWIVHRWARTVRPRIIMLENVKEFEDWGPLTAEGKPCKARRGKTFKFWKSILERHGYRVEIRKLRACDYGAPTIRNRLVMVARCDGQPIVWPKPTHGPGLLPYRTAADCIDWSIPCPSIFLSKEEGRALGCKRPLVDNTMRRIARGVMRYVVNAAEPFIVSVAHGDSGGRREYGIDEPLGTVTSGGISQALVTPFVTFAQHGGGNRSAGEPLHTVTASPKDQNCIIVPHLSRQFGKSVGSDIMDPVGTVTAGGGGKTALVAPTLVQTGYGERPGQAPRSLDLQQPLGTVVAGGGKHALVAAFLAQHNGGPRNENSAGRAADAPLSTTTTRGTQQQIVASHLVKLRGTCKDGQSATEPMPTVTAGGTHVGEVRAFLMKYYGTDQDPRLAEPLHTVTTKDRFGLVTVQVAGEEYYIADIGMRMLTPRELYRAQGFPDSYIIDPEVNGKRLNKGEQIRMCGNSVCPDVAAAVVRANVPAARRANMPLFGEWRATA